jgi:putative endonuclease
MNHLELGQAGEDIAANHLATKDYEIVARNYKWKQGEIDIICKQNGFLIIVEVKTRNSMALGKPYNSVNISKQRQLIKVTNAYIQENNTQEEVRFDVVSIVLNSKGMQLEHIENAFYPLV